MWSGSLTSRVQKYEAVIRSSSSGFCFVLLSILSFGTYKGKHLLLSL